MPGCAAIGCNNRSERGYTMKCFPRNPHIRRIWKERVCRADWEPSKNSFLCHVHFASDQWILSPSCRLKLKKNAIPSIFALTSTRKSPRKRRKFLRDEEQRLDYLSGSLDPILTLKSVIRKSAPSPYSANQRFLGMHDANDRIIGESREAAIGDGAMPDSLPRVTSSIEEEMRLIHEGQSVTTNAATEICNDFEKKHSIENREPVNDADKEVENTVEAVDLKRKSAEDATIESRNSDEVDVKPIVKDEITSETTSSGSTFTIKLTGPEEDVEDIVRVLGVDRLEAKPSEESWKNHGKLVTWMISVIDNSTSESIIAKKPKLEIEESPTDDTGIDWNWQLNGIVDVSCDNGRSPDRAIFHEGLADKFTDRPISRLASNSIPADRTTSCYNETWVNDLSKRLDGMEQLNRCLNEKLTNKERERKKLQLELGRRERRIKDLNRKLEAAKRVANNCKREMNDMRSLIPDRKIADERMKTFGIEASEKHPEVLEIKVEPDDSSVEEKYADRLALRGDNGPYRTVQDIFDESNDCDDEPCIIDTREDFMRQFKDTFEPRI